MYTDKQKEKLASLWKQACQAFQRAHRAPQSAPYAGFLWREYHEASALYESFRAKALASAFPASPKPRKPH